MNNTGTLIFITVAILVVIYIILCIIALKKKEYKEKIKNLEEYVKDLKDNNNHLYNRLSAESSKRTFFVTEGKAYSVQGAANEFKKIIDTKKENPHYTDDLEKISLLAALCNKDNSLFFKARLNGQLHGYNNFFTVVILDVADHGQYIDKCFMWQLEMKYWDMFKCETLPCINSDWSIQEDISHLYYIF